MIIKRKLRPPGLPARVIARPRLDDLFSALLDAHGTIGVFAAGGSGKSVQAQLFAARYGWPLAWLTLDEADRSGSRLLTYLAEALRPLAPAAPESVREALEAELSLAEVAAMLADSLNDTTSRDTASRRSGDERFLLVFDDCETVAGHDDAVGVLGVFLEYLPPHAHVLLLSREELETPVARMLLEGRIGRVSDADLALDVQEARALLAANGQADRDPSELLAATQGWVAAFAFDIGPGRAESGMDSFVSYLRTEIVGRLPEDEQRFLLYTSILNAVTPKMAVGLCGPEAYGLWRRVRHRHLPATVTADRTLVYHSRFRSFLREQLAARYPGAIPDLRHRQAGQLVEAGLHEEAVSILLDLGDLDEATVVAQRAVPQLINRADWRLLLRWFDQLGEDRVASHPLLEGARIRALYGTRQIRALQDRILTLHRTGELATIATADPGMVPYIGWSMQWRPAEALDLMNTYAGDYRADGVRYELRAVSGRDPVVAPAGRAWADAERIVSWGLLVQGRLNELVSMLPTDDEWPAVGYYRTPHPLLGLVWQGEIARARALLERVPTAVRAGAHTDLWYFHEAWLAWAEGDVETALHAAREAAAHSSRTGFGWEPCFDTMAGYFLVQLGRYADARTVLGESLRRTTACRNRAYAEWALTFEGLACLREGQPADAVRRLRRAMDGMRRARRNLMLPFAAMYLAEAEFQLGNAEVSVALADEAYDVAVETGALFVLGKALEDVPAVLERQIAASGGDDRWRRIARLPVAAPPAAAPSKAGAGRRVTARPADAVTTIELQPFGSEADLVVDGTPAGVRRIKVLELAAFVCLHPEGVERRRLQAALLPETDQRHGGNYYRQIVHNLRLSTGIGLARNGGGIVSWPADVAVDSVDRRFERLLHEAGRLNWNERLGRLTTALDLVVGEYLPDSSLEWVEERRFELQVLVTNATAEAAQLALSLGRMEQARDLAERAVQADPFSEPAYRTLLEVEAAVGPPGGVLTVYRRLTAALEGLNLRPDNTTEALMRRLRGASV